MRAHRRALAVITAVAVAGSLAGCGVTLQESAEPLPPNVLPEPLRIPTPAAPSPSASPSVVPIPSATPTSSRLRIWFVQDDGLAAVESSLPVGSAPDLIVQSLAVGPPLEDAEQGLRTVARDPLTGQALVAVAPTQPSPPAPGLETSSGAATGPPDVPPPVTPPSVTVTLKPAFSALPPSEQVLLLGQVVLSLAGAGEQTVEFVDDAGSPVAVPLPDGRLLDAPATARDYASLIVRP